MQSHTAYLALGANVGDRRRSLAEAARLLEAGGCRVTAASALYETAPVGVTDQPDFLNAALRIETSLAPRELLDLCALIEDKLGRRRTIRWGPRVIDVDILVYEGIVSSEPDLKLPHPRMLERSFVMEPLAEIAPDLVMPDGSTARVAAGRLKREGIKSIDATPWRGL